MYLKWRYLFNLHFRYLKILAIIWVLTTSFLIMHNLAFIEHMCIIQKPYDKLTTVDDEPFVSNCCLKPLAFRFVQCPDTQCMVYFFAFTVTIKINHLRRWIDKSHWVFGQVDLERRLNFRGVVVVLFGRARNMLEVNMFSFHDKSWGCYGIS